MRHKEAISSTRNMISSLKVFYILLYLRSSILQDIYFLYRIQRFVSGLIKYTCMNTRKLKGLDSSEIKSLPKSKKVMNMARHFNHCRK